MKVLHSNIRQAGLTPLIIVLVVAVIAASGAAVYIFTQSGSNQKSSQGSREFNLERDPKLTVNQKDRKLSGTNNPKPATPTPTPKTSTKSVKSETGTTSTGWEYTGFRDVVVVPTARSDKKAIYVDFIREDFDDLNPIYYNLTYDTDESETQRGISANFDASSETIQGYLDKVPYVRVELVLGTCSKGVCNYYNNPRNFELIVKTQAKGSSKEYEQTLSIETL